MTDESDGDKQIMDAIHSSIGADDINKQIHRADQVEVKGTDHVAEHVKTRDMQDVAMHGDLPYQQMYDHRDGGQVLRENRGQAAVDMKPFYTKNGWQFHMVWEGNHATQGVSCAVAIEHQKAEKKGDRAILPLDDMMMISEATPILEKKLEAFIYFCMDRAGMDYKDPQSKERMKLYNALQALPDVMMAKYFNTPYGKINNVTFVPSNSALESIELHD